MVEVDGIPMLDGGIADSVPVRRAIADGYDYNIVILTRKKGYYKNERSTSMMRLVKLYYRKYPKLAWAMLQRNHVYNQEMDLITRLQEQGKVFVIRPEVTTVGLSVIWRSWRTFTGMDMKWAKRFIHSCENGCPTGRNV